MKRIILILIWIGAFQTAIAVANINFTEHSIDSSFNGACGVFAIDLDDDGDVDVLGAGWDANDVSWWENNGSQSFTKHQINGTGFSGPSAVYALDLDTDGDKDVLASGWVTDDITWWENNGSESFTETDIDGFFQGAYDIYAINVDGDADIDVLGAARDGDQIAWWENDGSENFTKHTIKSNYNSAESVYAIDLDDDGDVDILGAAALDDDVTWWENDGSENFTEHTIDGSYDGATDVYALDLDDDGDVDVLAAADIAKQIAWWENNGSESFTKHVIDSTFDGSHDVFAIDLDADGDEDVLGAASLSDEIAWWENNGSESFTKHTIKSNWDFARFVYAIDLDGDGDMDVIGAASGTADDIIWWENDLQNTSPDISNVVRDPMNPGPSEVCEVSATITDNGTVASADLYYDAGSGYTSLTMSNVVDSFFATIPGQSASTTVYYYLSAKDNLGDSTISDTSSYTVSSSGSGDIGMDPDTYPIHVHPGGSFGLTGIIGNPNPDPIVTDVWVMLGLPGGSQYGPLWLFRNIPLSPGQYISAHLDQHIPGFAPQGTYDYIAYCGDYRGNPNNRTVCDSTCFEFTVSTGGGGSYDVGLVISDYDNAWSEAAQLLLASGEVSSASFVDARNSTPSLNDLLNYDVVIVWSNYTFNDNVALGDVLADYVDSGGAVVTANFCHYQSRWQLAGRYMTEYSPLGAGDSFGYGTNMVVDDPNHPIMAGVSAGYELYDHDAPLQNNPFMVQHWDNGYNGTTVNTDYPQCVALNNYFGFPDRQWTGDVGQMMVNAVLYAAGNTIGIWVSEPPEELIAYSPRFNKDVERISRSGGNSMPATKMLGDELTIPGSRALLNAYPNPFNAQTSITFNVPSSSKVNLEVYNLLGQNVATLVDGKIEAGQHTATWDASSCSSGIYFYKLTAGDKVITKRITLVK
jgi:hypothetical protein